MWNTCSCGVELRLTLTEFVNTQGISLFKDRNKLQDYLTVCCCGFVALLAEQKILSGGFFCCWCFFTVSWHKAEVNICATDPREKGSVKSIHVRLRLQEMTDYFSIFLQWGALSAGAYFMETKNCALCLWKIWISCLVGGMTTRLTLHLRIWGMKHKNSEKIKTNVHCISPQKNQLFNSIASAWQQFKCVLCFPVDSVL